MPFTEKVKIRVNWRSFRMEKQDNVNFITLSSFISIKICKSNSKGKDRVYHSEALEVTSKKTGFTSYYALQNSHANQSKLSEQP